MPTIDTAAVTATSFAALWVGHQLGEHAVQRRADAQAKATPDDWGSQAAPARGPAGLPGSDPSPRFFCAKPIHITAALTGEVATAAALLAGSCWLERTRAHSAAHRIGHPARL
jgi:hypothetical protein